MKAIFKILLGAVAVVTMASCVKENEIPLAKTYRATCSMDMTKASLGVDGYSVNWSNTDKIKIWYKSGDGFSFVEARVVENHGATAVFEYSIPDTDADLTTLYAVYGQCESESVITLKAEQNAVKDGFDPSALVMCAKYVGDGTEPHFSFRNFSSLLKLNIKNNCSEVALSKITFSVNPTADKYKTFTSKASWSIGSNGNASCTKLDYTKEDDCLIINGTFETGTYYIPILQSNTVYQTSISFVDTRGERKTFTNKYSTTFNRNAIVPSGDFTIEDSWFPPVASGEGNVLYSSVFSSDGYSESAGMSDTPKQYTIDDKKWTLVYADYTSYYSSSTPFVPYILMSVRKKMTECLSYAESANLVTEGKSWTVKSFSVNLSGRTSNLKGIVSVEYYDGVNWVTVDDNVALTINNKATEKFSYKLASPLTTSDFRIRVKYYYSGEALDNQYFVNFDGVKVLG